MVEDDDRVYVSKSIFEMWLRRMYCKPLAHKSAGDRDFWETKSETIFTVSRPEATAGGKQVMRDGKFEPAYDRPYALDVLNHVVGIYSLPAKFEKGDIFDGEPAVKLVRKPVQ
jgi:hypothetical protein